MANSVTYQASYRLKLDGLITSFAGVPGTYTFDTTAVPSWEAVDCCPGKKCFTAITNKKVLQQVEGLANLPLAGWVYSKFQGKT